MNFRIIFESFKFYKLKSDKAVKSWFVILIAMRLFVTIAPVGDREFKFLDYYLSGKFLETFEIVMPTKGNLLIIGIYALGLFIALCIALIYAEVFILENESERTLKIHLDSNQIFIFPLKSFAIESQNKKVNLANYIKETFTPSSFKIKITAEGKKKPPYATTAFKDLLRFLPALFLLLILLAVVFIVSSALLLIPFFIVFFILVFTPLNSMYSKNSLIRSMELSSAQTKGSKISIFFNFVMLNFFFNLIINLLLLFLAEYYYSFLMLEAFVFAIKILAFARLYGILYQIIALKQPYTIK